MLIVRFAVIVLVIVGLSVYAVLPGPEHNVPPVSGTETSNNENQPAAPKQEIAVSLPSSMNISVGGKLDKKSENQKDRANEESSKWLDPVTWLTLVLAIANILLWLTTRQLVEESKSTSMIARQAAQASINTVKAYQEAERAWLGLTKVDVTTSSGNNEFGNTVNGWLLSMKLVNGGRTPAIKCDGYSERRIEVGTDSENIPVFNILEHIAKTSVVVPNIEIATPSIFVSDNDVSRLVGNEIRLFIFTRVNYEDVFQINVKRHVQGCLRVYVNGTKQFDDGRQQPNFMFMPVGQQNDAS